MTAKVIPELDVSSLQKSLYFYIQLVGFKILYDRPEERFAFLELDGAQLMLEEEAGPGRRFRTAPLEPPYGRGMNLQISVADIDGMYARLTAAGAVIVLPMEETWYRRETEELGNRQFVVADPDGYLLRFFRDLGSRPAAPRV